MTTFLFTKQAAAEFQIDTSDRGSVMRDVLERVIALSKYSETEISNLMATEAGHQLVDLNVVDLPDENPDRYSSDWDDVVLASPEPLTDAEYQQVLLGEDATVATDRSSVELYGARVKIDP